MMTAPRRRACIAGRKACVSAATARQLTRIIPRIRSRGTRSNRPTLLKPALLIQDADLEVAHPLDHALGHAVALEVLGDDARLHAVLLAQLGAERLQPVRPARDQDHVDALRRELAGERR